MAGTCEEDFGDLMHPPDPPEVTTCVWHAPTPSGYVARVEWFRCMAKTHHQERCGECGLWAIWRLKPLRLDLEG